MITMPVHKAAELSAHLTRAFLTSECLTATSILYYFQFFPWDLFYKKLANGICNK